jgi:Kef-type K+ transport system membrane component KefB
MSVITPEGTLAILLVILTLGLLVPEIFRRFNIPFITIVILAGALIGPYGLNYIQPNEIISFFGFLGMTFLLLMAGLETKVEKVYKYRKKIAMMAFLNGLIPFLVGLTIARIFGYSWLASLLVGTIFISSAIAIIIPSLKSAKLFEKNVGQVMLTSILAVDVMGLIIFGIIFQSISTNPTLPFEFFIVLLFASIAALFFFTPTISKYLLRTRAANETQHESQLRFVIVFAIGALVLFSWIGVHPILAAFLVGLSLSFSLPKDRSRVIEGKLHTLGYGLFIPVFLFVIGMEMNLRILARFDITNLLMVSIVFGLIISKFASGYVAGRMVKFSHKHALSFGSATMIKLTTTLAISYAAFSAGIFDTVLVTSMIILTMVTTFLGPLAVNYINREPPRE